LIDQRTFECDWATVEHIAKFRTEPYKIELFYFLAASWMDRARAKKKPELLRRWWGSTDYADFFQLSGVDRAVTMAKRFKTELGYKFAHPFTIHERGVDGRTMYYMIHASDHHRASALMVDAYNAVKRIGFDAMDQPEMFSRLDSELVPPTR
jgi:three-Cys-motif partner protein